VHRASFVILGTAFLATLPTALAAERPDSEPASKLLSAASAQASQLKSDAQMVSYGAVHANINWTGRVDQVKEHIHTANRQIAELGEQRASGSPAQRATIDRVEPLLKELVANSEAVIRYAEEKPNRLRENKVRIAAHADLSSALASLIANVVQYGNARQRLQSLARGDDFPRR
jgi:DNA repair ATPase RecN